MVLSSTVAVQLPRVPHLDQKSRTDLYQSGFSREVDLITCVCVSREREREKMYLFTYRERFIRRN